MYLQPKLLNDQRKHVGLGPPSRAQGYPLKLPSHHHDHPDHKDHMDNLDCHIITIIAGDHRGQLPQGGERGHRRQLSSQPRKHPLFRSLTDHQK